MSARDEACEKGVDLVLLLLHVRASHVWIVYVEYAQSEHDPVKEGPPSKKA